jgi:hypothetical protein
MASKRTTTTKDIGLLIQLRDNKQLSLAPEFQRNAIWPRPAKAYLVDTILSDRPIPLLFFSRYSNAQTGKTEYEVIDGQQRLRAVFDFVENKFRLTESAKDSPWYGYRWKNLAPELKEKILNYDFVVEELSGYAETDIHDMFRRMNRYVVPLNAQEQRHAVESGKFKEFVEEVGLWPFWKDERIFSSTAASRRRTDEYAAELAILLLEGPQDKKNTIDLYYTAYKDEFSLQDDLRDRLLAYTNFIKGGLPSLKSMQLRRPANFYALIGALDKVTNQGEDLSELNQEAFRELLERFDQDIQADEPNPVASRYVRAASRQTDNIAPRRVRIDTLAGIIEKAR